MRKILPAIVLATCAALVLPATAAQATTIRTGSFICILEYSLVGQPTWLCIPLADASSLKVVRAVDLRLTALPPAEANQVVDDIASGIEQLDAAAHNPGPGPSHTNGINDLLAAATTLGTVQLTQPVTGSVDPNGVFIPNPHPWLQQAADDFSQGINAAEQLLADRNPQIFDIVVPMFDEAYHVLQQGALTGG